MLNWFRDWASGNRNCDCNRHKATQIAYTVLRLVNRERVVCCGRVELRLECVRCGVVLSEFVPASQWRDVTDHPDLPDEVKGLSVGGQLFMRIDE